MPWTLAFDKFSTRKEMRVAQGEWVERLIEPISSNARKTLGLLSGDLQLIALALLASVEAEGDGAERRYVGAFSKGRAGVSPLMLAESKMGRACDARYGELEKAILGAFENAISDFFSLMCYELQHDNGRWEPVSQMGEAQLAQMANAKWFDGQRFSDRLWSDKEALKRALRRVLTQGINLGWGAKEMSNALASAVGQAQYVVERLIRTEMNRVQNQAILRAYKENGVREYEYVAILDERTSEVCEGLNGRRFLVADAEPGVNLPPMHPNCRSSTIPIAPGKQQVDKDLERLDYEQWLKNFLKGA